MVPRASKRSGMRLLCPVAALALVVAPGCGCGKRGPKHGTADQLRQRRLMFSSNKKGRTCYIVAEVENTGELPVPRARATATLRSATGKTRGVNHHLLRNLKPGEVREFSMTVSAHDSFQHVDLSFSDPQSQ